MVELDHFLHPGILSLQFVLVAPDLLLLVTYKILLLSPDLLRPLKRLEQLLVIDLEVLVFDVHAVCMLELLLSALQFELEMPIPLLQCRNYLFSAWFSSHACLLLGRDLWNFATFVHSS